MPATRIQIERILCPTDFSKFSSRALWHATALASRFEARLSVLHVMPSVVSSTGGPYFPATLEMRQRVDDELRRFAAPAVRAGVPTNTELREGEPWREIQAAAEALPADLLVMGTHGRAGFDHLLLGSVAEKVLRRSPCPVLTVCRDVERASEAPGLFDRILCAADLSESSGLTIALALSLAAENQAELTLLHVLESLPPYRAVPEMGTMHRELEQMARKELGSAVPQEAREWCTIQELMTVGRAHKEILRVAAEQRADLIVMGTHGHGPIEQRFFGSTSQQVVRAASCPVLTVRPLRHVREAPGEKAAEAVAAPGAKG